MSILCCGRRRQQRKSGLGERVIVLENLQGALGPADALLADSCHVVYGDAIDKVAEEIPESDIRGLLQKTISEPFEKRLVLIE